MSRIYKVTIESMGKTPEGSHVTINDVFEIFYERYSLIPYELIKNGVFLAKGKKEECFSKLAEEVSQVCLSNNKTEGTSRLVPVN
jgi:hypothetical protein